MKNLSTPSIDHFKYLIAAIMLGCFILLLAGTASAQAPAKNKKADKVPHATLKEAKVTARMLTTVEEVSPMKIKLNVLNPTGKTVRIAILNFQNEPVFKDAFTGKEYNRTINFNTTLSGRYSLHINSPKQSEVRRFAIDSKQIRNLNQSELVREGNSDILVAIHKTEPNKIMLQLANNTGEWANYVFRNEAKEVIYSGVSKDAQYLKIFDMAPAKDGMYTLEVKYQDKKIAARTFDMQTINNRSFAWVDKRGKPLKPAAPAALTQK